MDRKLSARHTAPRGARLAAVGAALVTAGVAAYLKRPARRPPDGESKHESLIAYLHEHLSGADAAIRVVQRLGSRPSGTDTRLFQRLAKEFEEDRAVVRTLLAELGASPRSVKRVAGIASGALLSVTAGGAPGELSLLRTLEALAIGVQGKRCLWRALQRLGTAGGGHSFTALEAKAVRQWEALERRRRQLTVDTFPELA